MTDSPDFSGVRRATEPPEIIEIYPGFFADAIQGIIDDLVIEKEKSARRWHVSGRIFLAVATLLALASLAFMLGALQ